MAVFPVPTLPSVFFVILWISFFWTNLQKNVNNISSPTAFSQNKWEFVNFVKRIFFGMKKQILVKHFQISRKSNTVDLKIKKEFACFVFQSINCLTENVFLTLSKLPIVFSSIQKLENVLDVYQDLNCLQMKLLVSIFLQKIVWLVGSLRESRRNLLKNVPVYGRHQQKMEHLRKFKSAAVLGAAISYP